MSTVSERIARDALALPESERAALAEELVDSLNDPALTDVEEAWVEEAERRYSEYRNGNRATISEDDFFPRIRRALGWES